MINNAGTEAAIRKLRATLARQEEAVAATQAQIDIFEKLLVESRQQQLELVRQAKPGK